MAKWEGLVLTNAGADLLDRLLAGNEIEFTRVALGDGLVDNPDDRESFSAMTNLVNHKWDLPVSGIDPLGNGEAVISAKYTNKGLTEGFTVREMGIFAKDENGNEILFEYDNCNNKTNYLPAYADNIAPISLNWDIHVIIKSIQNVSINITYSESTTKEEFEKHVISTNPHPEFIKKMGYLAKPTTFWTHNGDGNLYETNVEDTRKTILGDASTIPVLTARLSQVETELANSELKQLAENACPNSNLTLVEDFKNPDVIDTFSVAVKSVVAGDNGIDVESIQGITRGSWYQISDGVNSESLQVDDVIKNGSVYRLLIKTDKGENIVNTYDIPNTRIYRTTSMIDTSKGIAYGAGTKKGFNWTPDVTWKGISANVASVIKLDTSQSNADSFKKTGDVAFTADGLFTIATD